MKPRSAVVTKQYPRRKDADGNYLCAVCGKALPNWHRKYCSRACADVAWVACIPQHARLRVRQRDKGVCARCGCDTEKVKRILKHLSRFNYDGLGIIKRELGFTRYHLWEVHHRIAVSEGGGLCGLGNLETLCIPCHNAETAALRRKPKTEPAAPLFAKATP